MIDADPTSARRHPPGHGAAQGRSGQDQGAAKQFEALLIGQMMKSMHDSEGGWLGTGDDESASSAMEYGQEIFAQAMAASGGLGLSALVAKGLEK